jgi:DNA helicase-2/ATP-dependent DNA helicase PcrA
VYADAGRREGLDVRGAYVHDLAAGERSEVNVTAETVTSAEVVILDAAERLQARAYAPSPGPACRRCEVRTVCKAAKR